MFTVWSVLFTVWANRLVGFESSSFASRFGWKSSIPKFSYQSYFHYSLTKNLQRSLLSILASSKLGNKGRNLQIHSHRMNECNWPVINLRIIGAT